MTDTTYIYAYRFIFSTRDTASIIFISGTARLPSTSSKTTIDDCKGNVLAKLLDIEKHKEMLRKYSLHDIYSSQNVSYHKFEIHGSNTLLRNIIY